MSRIYEKEAKMDISEISIYDILTSLSGPGKREGRCFKFRSPFRDERTPSFAIYPESNTWFDFGLGEGGDIVNLFMRLYNCSYREALCEIEALVLSPEFSGENRTHENPSNGDAPQTRNYSVTIKSTKVEEYFRSVGLSLPPGTGAFLAKLKGNDYIAFPCPDKRNPTGLECRAIKDVEPRRLSLFKKDVWFYERKNNHIAITESIFDCLAMSSLVRGEYSLLALNGLGNKNKAINFVKRINPRFVFIALDNDTHGAGQKVQEELERVFKESGFRVENLSWLYKRHNIKDFYRLKKVLDNQ